jgi:DNA-binding XRE family transcriptional regulator
MAPTVLLFTDRPAFEQAWVPACEGAGLSVRAVAPEAAADQLASGVGAVFDAGSAGFDEDELLACVGLARALGAQPVVASLANGAFSGIEDMLEELCRGLVGRADADATRIAAGLARRCDQGREGRFEYLSVSPRGTELLAILGDGQSALLSRPVSEQDDGSEIAAIHLAEDARAAQVELASGARFSVSAADLGERPRNGASNGNGHSIPATLGDVHGVRLGQRLRALRLSAGLTQAELARRTGIHRPNIARVEAGRHTPSLETLARLAAAIGVPTTRVLSD